MARRRSRRRRQRARQRADARQHEISADHQSEQNFGALAPIGRGRERPLEDLLEHLRVDFDARHAGGDRRRLQSLTTPAEVPTRTMGPFIAGGRNRRRGFCGGDGAVPAPRWRVIDTRRGRRSRSGWSRADSAVKPVLWPKLFSALAPAPRANRYGPPRPVPAASRRRARDRVDRQALKSAEPGERHDPNLHIGLKSIPGGRCFERGEVGNCAWKAFDRGRAGRPRQIQRRPLEAGSRVSP